MSDLAKLFGVNKDDLIVKRIPSLERGCERKINLGSKPEKQAQRMANRHKSAFGVYRCPHCGGTHLTTKLERQREYEPLLLIVTPQTNDAGHS